jgi:hypothetical protein
MSLRGILKKLRSNFNLTCIASSVNTSLIFLKTSLFNCEQIDDPPFPIQMSENSIRQSLYVVKTYVKMMMNDYLPF